MVQLAVSKKWPVFLYCVAGDGKTALINKLARDSGCQGIRSFTFPYSSPLIFNLSCSRMSASLHCPMLLCPFIGPLYANGIEINPSVCLSGLFLVLQQCFHS